jgi:hypothetical protein
MGLGVVRMAARAPDSYGLLFALVVIDYVLLSVGWEGGLQTVVVMVFIGPKKRASLRYVSSPFRYHAVSSRATRKASPMVTGTKRKW